MATKRTIAVRGIFSPRSIDELYEVRHVVVPYVDDEAEKLRETPPPEDDEQPANEWWLHSAGGHNTDAHGDVAQVAAAHSERPSRQAAHADTVTLDETPAVALVAFCPAAIVGNYASGAVCAEADDAELDSAVLTISATAADATAGIAASPVAAHGAEWHQLEPLEEAEAARDRLLLSLPSDAYAAFPDGRTADAQSPYKTALRRLGGVLKALVPPSDIDMNLTGRLQW